MAAFTFSSCEDVPAPYDMPTKPETPEELQPTGSGTAVDPFNIAAVESILTKAEVQKQKSMLRVRLYL